VNQTDGPQDGEVLADRGPGHVEGRRDVARRQLGPRDEAQDGAPARFREGFQQVAGIKGHPDKVSDGFRQPQRTVVLIGRN
jgi:hypothetical protein